MHFTILLAFLSLNSIHLSYALEHSTRGACQPFSITFDQSASPGFYSHFIPISPEDSYALTDNGLEMYLYKPKGRVTTSDGVNDQIGNGATINSTTTLVCVPHHFELKYIIKLYAGTAR
jgi:hypothetical protein